jgi:predicted XRE-type DNA-binding protein
MTPGDKHEAAIAWEGDVREVIRSFPEDARAELGLENRGVMANPNRPTHMTYGSVLDDLGFSPEKAAILKLKAEMHREVLRSARKYSRKELETVLQEPQPRISELLNGKIASVSFEKLAIYAMRLGAKPTIKIVTSRKRAPGKKAPAAARPRPSATAVVG